jgi:predicted transposase/invertase (TIGR01784 family)
VAVKATEEGIKQGLKQGVEQQQLETARRSLSLLDDATISQITGLSIEDIQQLRNE